MFYSGCNYFINSGAHELEPVGTATSMHECGSCEDLERCKLKQTSDIWPINEDIKKQMDKDFREMQTKC